MNADELRAAQAPLKARYRAEPGGAVVNLTASGTVDAAAQVARVTTHLGVVDAGLHAATGGDGTKACSGDMLLQALVACAVRRRWGLPCGQRASGPNSLNWPSSSPLS